MALWSPLPLREPGSRITRLDFSKVISTTGNREIYKARFRHWDNRVWDVGITDNTDDEVINTTPSARYLIAFRSLGCRVYMLAARSVESAKRVANRFSNFNEELYARLVVDARGTSDHPQSAQVGVFRINIATTPSGRQGYHEIHQSTISGIGRISGHTLVIFPTSNEIREILDDVADGFATPIVPNDINVVLDLNRPEGFGQTTVEIETPDISSDQLAATVERLFSSTMDDGFKQYQVPSRPRKLREHRVIDLGSNPQEQHEDQ